MTSFANHNRSYEEWWAELSPMLTNDALLAYEGTNPARVRPSQVTGPGVVASAPNFNQMSVLVPTDIGQYTIELIRQGDGHGNGTPSWFVDRLTPRRIWDEGRSRRRLRCHLHPAHRDLRPHRHVVLFPPRGSSPRSTTR